MNPPDFTPPASSQPAGNAPPVHNPLSVMQPGEQVICHIKRHPLGIFGIYTTCGVLLIALAVLVFIGLPKIFGADSAAVVVGTLVFILVTVLVVIFTFVANVIYWGNSWVVTSDSLTQITQTNLFSKQSSQLSLGNLEDVSSEKNGMLAQLLNVGMLKAETAGERSKFVFLYCPNPDYYAQKILAAREQFEQAHHGGKQEPYVAASAPQPAPQPQSQAPPIAPPVYPDQPYDSRSADTNT